ncbi:MULTISPECIES: flagellin N-terminal helical domain-containing protein [Exiguobacterium]|uniref:flagellin N-terminal helical domain-containing protein n=1 Tax=Exiguobacterium TaxID=33986 RepID=UPI000478D1A0|nr:MULTISPECIES: flagellin [Exiguobacterium]
MIINHNLNSMNAHRNMSFNTAQTGKAMEKLSSGLRINRAGDDAAGLAISEKMRGQIRGLDQATRNSQDGISLIQTGEGALNETHSILQRMRELSVQSANDTNTTQDRSNIQDEMKQLGTEVDRIANQTEFNTKKLLNGAMGSAQATATGTIVNNSGLDAAAADGTVLNVLTDKAGNNLGLQTGDVITASWSVNGTQQTATFTIADAAVDTMAAINTAIAGNATVTTAATASGATTITAATGGSVGQINGFAIEVKSATGERKEAASNALSNFEVGTEAKDVRNDGSATFHIGANNGQTINLSISDMRASTLGVKDLQVGTQSQAETAVKVIDQAIQKVSVERSKLGSVQNRLEHTINNLSTSAENLQAAESRVRDVDMAKEMMNFTKNNILNQAAQAMMAQSNQQPQAVLQLLR